MRARLRAVVCVLALALGFVGETTVLASTQGHSRSTGTERVDWSGSFISDPSVRCAGRARSGSVGMLGVTGSVYDASVEGRIVIRPFVAHAAARDLVSNTRAVVAPIRAWGARTTLHATFVATNTFEPSPKHDQTRPGVGAQPTNGQLALGWRLEGSLIARGSRIESNEEWNLQR